MARPCSICNHTERLEIDRLLLSGEPYRNIAKRFNVSIGGISRHKENHIGTDLRDVHEAMIQAREEALSEIKEGTKANELETLETIKDGLKDEIKGDIANRLELCRDHFEQLKILRERAAMALERAESSDDSKATASFIRELRELIRLWGELEGKLQSSPQITIVNDPEWIEIRTLIITALDDYPEAKEAVVHAIRGR